MVFDESTMPYKTADQNERFQQPPTNSEVDFEHHDSQNQGNEPSAQVEEDILSGEESEEPEPNGPADLSESDQDPSGAGNLSDYLLVKDRTRRDIRPPARYMDADFVYYALCVAEELEISEPSTYKEAVGSKDKHKWIKAMNEEIDSLLKNKTWVLVLRSQIQQRPISCKWIYKKKVEASENDNVRFKARLVARGFTQEEGVDYTEVFSPVVKHSSIRILLALVAKNNWELQQLDVKTAFLHGELEETIYMEQPQGFIKPRDEDKVCCLKRSLYGLKQSSRQWYLTFDKQMEIMGFRKSAFDNCVYIRYKGGTVVAYLLLYVDDMLVAGPSKAEIN